MIVAANTRFRSALHDYPALTVVTIVDPPFLESVHKVVVSTSLLEVGVLLNLVELLPDGSF